MRTNLSYFVFLVVLSFVQCDYYTSVVDLSNLLGVESLWVEQFEKYVQALEKSNALIKKYIDDVDNKILKDFEPTTESLYADPIGSIKGIKRFINEWNEWENFVLNPKESEDYAKNLTQIETEYAIEVPTEEDLLGAAAGIARLQSTYDLNPVDVANGKLLTAETSANMTAGDCYYLGRTLYKAEDYQHAIEWLIEARTRVPKKGNGTELEHLLEIEDADILEFLAPAFFNIGNYKMAVKINSELLSLDPANENGLSNAPLYQHKLFEQHDLESPRNFSLTIPNNQTDLERRYEAVCREELKQKPAEKRNLRCRYVTNNVPFCLLAPLKFEELSLDPPVVYYHEAIYDSEIENIVEYSVEILERSRVGTTFLAHTAEIRTSKNSWLWYERHRFLDAFAQRLTDMTGLSLKSAEPLQVANYGIGGHFGPHHDCRDYSSDEMGNRIATALIYMNDVELGGGTAFPILRILVPPVRRSMLLWYNMHESSEFDYRMIHAGCPVLKGSKWICNEWFHEDEQEFRRPCSLQQRGNKSIEYRDLIDWHLYDRLLEKKDI